MTGSRASPAAPRYLRRRQHRAGLLVRLRQAHARRSRGTSAFTRASASGPFEPFQRDLPIPPVARPVARRRARGVRADDEARHGRRSCPGYRRRSSATTGASRGRRSRPRAGARSKVRMLNNSGRELNTHLHGGVTPTAVRRAPARPDPQRRRAPLPLPERPARSATMWYHDHAHGETAKTVFAGLAGVLHPRRPGRQAPRSAPGRLRRAADDHGPRVQRRRLVPLQARRRPRLPRRHDPGQRRGRAAHDGRAAALPAALPQRLQRPRVQRSRWATSAPMVADRLRRRAAAAPVVRTSIPMEPAERVEVLVDFRQVGVGSQVVLHNTIGEATTQAVMRFDVVARRASRRRACRRGSPSDDDLPEVNAQRTWPLTFQGLAGVLSGRSRGADFARPDRLPPAAGLLGAVDVRQPVRSAPTRCTCTATTSASSAIDGKPPHPGDRGWKDTVAVYPHQTVVVRPNFDYYAGATSSTATPPSTATCR